MKRWKMNDLPVPLPIFLSNTQKNVEDIYEVNDPVQRQGLLIWKPGWVS